MRRQTKEYDIKKFLEHALRPGAVLSVTSLGISHGDVKVSLRTTGFGAIRISLKALIEKRYPRRKK